MSDMKRLSEYGDGSMISRHVLAVAICENDNGPAYGKRDGTGVCVTTGVAVGVGVDITLPQLNHAKNRQLFLGKVRTFRGL